MGVGGSLVFKLDREVQEPGYLIMEYCLLLVILASVCVAQASYGSHGFRSSYRQAPYQSYGSTIGYRSTPSYHGARQYQPALAHHSIYGGSNPSYHEPRSYQTHARIPFGRHQARFNHYEPRSYQKHARNPYGRFQSSYHRPQHY